MNKKLLAIFIIGVFCVSLVSAHWWDPFHWVHDPEGEPEPTGYEIATNQKAIFLKKFTGLEKYIISEKSAKIVGDNLEIDLIINTTVYNFFKDAYQNPTMAKCLKAEPYIKEDYPLFNCSNSAHQNLLLTKVQNFATKGIKLFRQGITQGYTNITGNKVKIRIPVQVLIDKEIIEIGEDSLAYEVQNQTSIFYSTNFNNMTISLQDDDMPLSVNDINITDNGDNLKFSGLNNNMTDTELRNHTYVVKSTSELYKDGRVIYVKNPKRITTDSFGYYEIHKFDFNDVCKRGFNSWNETVEIDNETFVITHYNVTAQCEFTSYEVKVDENNTDYYYEVSFISDKFIDPSISIGSSDWISTSLLTNVTAESGDANFTHLNISDVAPYDSLVGYWNFDLNASATTYDYTRFDNDATLVGVVEVVAGKYGNGILFPAHAASYVNLNIPSGDPANMANNFTWTAWIRPDGNPQNSNGIIWRFRANKEAWINDDGTLTGRVYIGGSIIITTTTTAVADSQVAHVALVYNGSSLYWVINGTAQPGEVASGVVTQSSWVSHIGANGGSNNGFNGMIDEVMIFNTSLTTQQIQDIYNNASARFKPQGMQKVRASNIAQDGSFDTVNLSTTIQENMDSRIEARIGQINLSVNSSGLVYYAPFEWGSAVDISGEGNDGTIVGATFNETGGLNDSGGFSFDGSGDYVDVTVTQDKNSTSLWYKNSTASTWTHVAKNQTAYFVNGVVGSPVEYPLNISGNAVKVGVNGTTYFNGIIDNVLIFNRSLSSQEITDLYNNQSAAHNIPYYTDYQNITTDTNETFTISTEADFIFPDYKFWAGNSTVAFYSPLISGDVLLEAYVGAASGDTCTYNTGNWIIDCSDNCVISDDVDLSGNNISLSGTGTFITSANITNFGKFFIKGTDSSNICKVTCLAGGCFRW